MSQGNQKLFKRADGHAWVGETPQDATHVAAVPGADDSRWVPGVPSALDTEVLTLSPFFPSGRLGVCVERKSSHPLGRYPNHPAFAGCRAWMPVDAIDWKPAPQPEAAPQLPQRPAPRSLGNTKDEILDAFKEADGANVGRQVTEAAIIGASLRFRWQGSGKLGVVVGEICLRDASDAEYDELEEAIELGQVQIYLKPLYVSGRSQAPTEVLHQATGNPLDENSQAAIRQRDRWAQAERRRPGR